MTLAPQEQITLRVGQWMRRRRPQAEQPRYVPAACGVDEGRRDVEGATGLFFISAF